MREKKFAGVDNWRSRLFWEVLLAAVIFFLAIKPEEVQADLILEPEDQFYQAHADQCEYVDRSYYTDGSVDFWTAPNGRKKGVFRQIPGFRLPMYIQTARERNGVCFWIRKAAGY